MPNTIPHIWTIGGGKGGTGKSFFTGSLGYLLAGQGCRTLLVDLDLGAANLHTIIGLSQPEKSVADFIHKRVAGLDDTVVPSPHPNLWLISGAMNNLDIPNLAHEQKQKLLRHLVRLPYDYILLDLGAGTAYNTIDFFLIAHVAIFITTPEPTAIENIYRLVRSVYFRKIHQVLKTNEFKALAGEAERQNPLATISNPNLLLSLIAQIDPQKAVILDQALGNFEFKLALNQLRKQDSPNIGVLICKIIARHLGLKMESIGHVGFDDRVHAAVCRRRPFLELYPYAQTALDLRGCCRLLQSGNHDGSLSQAMA